MKIVQLNNILLKKVIIIALVLCAINFYSTTFASDETFTGAKIQGTRIIGNKNLSEIRKNRRNKRLEEIKNVKQNFEIKKEKIINNQKSGGITKEEAKKRIIEEKKKLINYSKNKIEEEKEKLKNENLNILRPIIKEKLDIKLQGLKNFSKIDQKKIYTKLIDKLNNELNKNNISNNNKIIINLMKEIIINIKNRLN